MPDLRALAAIALLGLPAAAAEPSFDCARAESSAEKAICASDDLAALDREVARLYGLAVGGPNIGDGEDTLRAMQRGWIKGRDDCWKATIGLDACVAGNLVLRIYELRQGFADARGADADGISIGPLTMVCDQIDAGIGVGYTRSEVARAVLQWQETTLILTGVPSASGARFEGTGWDGGPVVFLTKGMDAILDLPGAPETACRFEQPG